MTTKKAPRDWSPSDIRKALYIAQGGTGAQTIIARDLGITPKAVCKVIDGDVSDRVRRAIAAYVGVTPETIWPSVYIHGDLRRPGRPRARRRQAA